MAAQDDCQELAGELHTARAQQGSLERTLQLTSDELSRAQAQLTTRYVVHAGVCTMYCAVLRCACCAMRAVQCAMLCMLHCVMLCCALPSALCTLWCWTGLGLG